MLLLFISLFLVACGDADDGNDNPQEQQAPDTTGTGNPSKSLFSSWRRNDSVILDLRGRSFNRPSPITLYMGIGSTCRCTMTISGTETSGTFRLTSCFWNADGPGDPGCIEQRGMSSYRKSANFLNWLCPLNSIPASCGIYN